MKKKCRKRVSCLQKKKKKKKTKHRTHHLSYTFATRDIIIMVRSSFALYFCRAHYLVVVVVFSPPLFKNEERERERERERRGVE